MKFAFFLGAGASKSCGAPLQSEMLVEYFRLHKNKEIPNDYDYFQYPDIYNFLLQFFGIDVEHDNLDEISFPTFEEILGLLELALIRKDSFRNFKGANIGFGETNRLLTCHKRIIGLMAILLQQKLQNIENNHESLIQYLMDRNILENSIFISSNYDILIDNALIRNDYSINYGFDMQDDNSNHQKKIPLYKLHGSLNWLYCPTCKKMQLTPLEKGAVNYYYPDRLELITCTTCDCIKQPVIIPPTYFKEFSNHLLNQVWYKAEQSLKEVNKIFFCGYSFPDADIQIKYLLKRAEIIGEQSLSGIYIVNNFEDKSEYDKNSERERYRRFFQQGKVHYLDIGFEQLIQHLDEYI